MKHWIWVQLSAHTETGHLAKLCQNTGDLQIRNYNECPCRPERRERAPRCSQGTSIMSRWAGINVGVWCREGEGMYGWVALWSLSTLIHPHFLLGCYLHTCCHGDRQGNVLSECLLGSCSHMHIQYIQITALQANTHICANLPNHLLLTIIEKSIWAADYAPIFERLKISLLSWFTWFIKVPDEADISQRKLSQRQRW